MPLIPVEIPLTHSYIALVDEVDAERVLAHRWFANVQPGGRVYAVGRVGARGRKLVFMHRFIWGADAPPRIDHRDHDGLNNQRSNLRAATHSQNLANCHPERRPNKHGFRGVEFNPKSGLFYGILQMEKVRFRTRGYHTPLDAARARDALALVHHGEFASLNFPRAEDSSHSHAAGPIVT